VCSIWPFAAVRELKGFEVAISRMREYQRWELECADEIKQRILCRHETIHNVQGEILEAL
jgi:hypothetical protein